jgi:hypothetical protein
VQEMQDLRCEDCRFVAKMVPVSPKGDTEFYCCWGPPISSSGGLTAQVRVYPNDWCWRHEPVEVPEYSTPIEGKSQ